MNPFVLFWLFLKGSLLSTGGFGNFPILHDDLISRGWATERDFAESLTVGQITPGPNGLWAICLGYMVDGVRGGALALVAISLPPLLILLIDRFFRSVQHHPVVEGFARGLALSVTGIFVVVVAGLLAGIGCNAFSLLMVVGGFGLAATRRVPVAVILGAAALIGMGLR
jgi:chromate transporter